MDVAPGRILRRLITRQWYGKFVINKRSNSMGMKLSRYRRRIAWIVLAAPLMIFAFADCARSQPGNALVALKGVWEGTKRETRDGETGEGITIDGNPYDFDYLIQFKENGVFQDIGNNEASRYSIKHDGLLHIGNSFYVIEKLTSDSLVLLEIDKDDPDDPFVFRTYYKKKSD